MELFTQAGLLIDILPVSTGLFVIKGDDFENRISYFAVFEEEGHQEFKYGIHVVNYEQDPVGRDEISRCFEKNR